MSRKSFSRKLRNIGWLTFFIAITFAYFVWLTWDKLTEFIGDSTKVWMITGVVVLLALVFGVIKIKDFKEKFS